MKLKKIIGLLTCVALILAVSTGCQQTVKSPFVSADTKPAPSTSAAPGGQTINIAGAYASLDPKTVMMKVGDRDITWDELFFFINYRITEVQSNGGEITNWSDIYQDETTYKDYVLNSAVNDVLKNAAINYGAAQQKLSLTPADLSSIQADLDSKIKAAGSEEAFLASLQSQYCSKDLYTRLIQAQYLAQDCFVSLYGEQGAKLSDQDVADYTAEDGYMMAKHIIMLTIVTDENGNQTPIADAEKTKVKEKMEEILKQLKSYTGNDFNGYFDQLMNQYSEDKGGLTSNPNGYLFQSGDLSVDFEEGTKALQIGQFSPELVAADYGYHIIYRIPINYDVTPEKYASYGNYALRFIAANGMFGSIISSWQSKIGITYSDKYKSLDFNKIFAAG